jgi:hypothetical protein
MVWKEFRPGLVVLFCFLICVLEKGKKKKKKGEKVQKWHFGRIWIKRVFGGVLVLF